jgi:hypothetical protein
MPKQYTCRGIFVEDKAELPLKFIERLLFQKSGFLQEDVATKIKKLTARTASVSASYCSVFLFTLKKFLPRTAGLGIISLPSYTVVRLRLQPQNSDLALVVRVQSKPAKSTIFDMFFKPLAVENLFSFAARVHPAVAKNRRDRQLNAIAHGSWTTCWVLVLNQLGAKHRSLLGSLVSACSCGLLSITFSGWCRWLHRDRNSRRRQDPQFHRIAEQVAGVSAIMVDGRGRLRVASFVRSTAIPQWLARSATQWLRARVQLARSQTVHSRGDCGSVTG